MISFTIPARTVSEANRRGHWSKHDSRRKAQKEQAYIRALASFGLWRGDLAVKVCPLVVALTRVAPRKLDSDNNVSAMKAIRDGIAYALGIDDGDERLEWKYAQTKGKPGEYAVLVTIEPKENA